MKKRRALVLVALFTAGIFAVARPLAGKRTSFLQSSFGAGIEIAASDWTPGGIILAKLKNGLTIKMARLHFLDREYVMGNTGDGLEPVVWIGLDIDLKPSVYGLSALFEGPDGRTEERSGEITILERTFSVTRMRVPPSYIQPPPHILERMRKEAELLRQIYSRSDPRRLAQGSFTVPHPAPISPNFGQRRIYGDPKMPSVHYGVDLAVPHGEPIKASNAGRVVLAQNLYLSGNSVIVDHGLGLFTVYCHMSRLLVKEGADVYRGQVLGLCGSTGRSTGPHLHWGAKIFDSRVDPTALLALESDLRF